MLVAALCCHWWGKENNHVPRERAGHPEALPQVGREREARLVAANPAA